MPRPLCKSRETHTGTKASQVRKQPRGKQKQTNEDKEEALERKRKEEIEEKKRQEELAQKKADEEAKAKEELEAVDEEERKGDDKRKVNPYIVFVGQLKYTTTKSDLMDHIKEHLGDKIAKDCTVRILTDSKTG